MGNKREKRSLRTGDSIKKKIIVSYNMKTNIPLMKNEWNEK